MNTILTTVIMLGVLAAVLAIVLYFVAQKFKVQEDPRIEEVESNMPGANCGGCGFAGCHAFADNFVKADDISKFYCPVGGNAVMTKIAAVVGKAVEAKESQVAVVRCNGSCENRPRTSEFNGATSCAVEAMTYAGDTACAFGCLGCGDCVAACNFGAIKMNPVTRLPEVDEDKCTACGACAKACPKTIIEIRKKGPKNRRLYVACMNKDKGAIARKACKAACIGCKACEKACAFDAVHVTDFLAYIDPAKCKLCRKCAEACPTGAIHEINLPPRKPKEEAKPAAEKVAVNA